MQHLYITTPTHSPLGRDGRVHRDRARHRCWVAGGSCTRWGIAITKLRPVGGFCAETGGALSILLATQLGIPVSTTHAITGAIVGVGATTRLSAVRWGVAGRIVWAWILTIPAAAAMAAVCWLLLSRVTSGAGYLVYKLIYYDSLRTMSWPKSAASGQVLLSSRDRTVMLSCGGGHNSASLPPRLSPSSGPCLISSYRHRCSSIGS